MSTNDQLAIFEEAEISIGRRLVFLCSWLPPSYGGRASLYAARLRENVASNFGLVSVALGLSMLARRSLLPQLQANEAGKLSIHSWYTGSLTERSEFLESHLQRGGTSLPLIDAVGNYGNYCRSLSQLAELFISSVQDGGISVRAMPSRTPIRPSSPIELRRERTSIVGWRGLSLDLEAAKTLSSLDAVSDQWPDAGLLLRGYVDQVELEAWATRNGLQIPTQDGMPLPDAAPTAKKEWTGKELCRLEDELIAAGHRDHNKRTQEITGYGERKIRSLKEEHRASLRPPDTGVAHVVSALNGRRR